MNLISSVVTRSLLPVTLLLVTSSFATSAAAQSTEESAGARVAATQGFTAFQAGNWQQALDMFKRAESLVHAPPHLLFMARAHEKLGHLVEARELYMKVTKENIAPNAPKAFQEAQVSAQQELPVIEPRIPTPTIKLTGVAEGEAVEVKLDDKVIPAALVGLPYPTNPGKHTLTARAEGKSSKPKGIDVTEGSHDTIEIALEPDPTATLAPPVTKPEAPPPAATVTPTGTAPATPEHDRGERSRPVPMAVWIGVGVTGVLVLSATATGIAALSKRSKFDGINDESHAEDAKQAAHDDATSMGLVNTVLTGAAVVGAGITTYLFFTRPEVAAGRDARLRVSPWVAVGGGGLTVGGAL